jgi:hypothetical protein
MPDLFAAAAPSVTRITPAVDALAALARAFAHDHALGFPRRNPTGEWLTPPPPAETWIARYAETQGLQQARRFLDALHRLPRDQREAIAADLLTETTPDA